jgi:adenosylcobinamide kinase/adenosylcobinamide-phosphate guanylyltransferase
VDAEIDALLAAIDRGTASWLVVSNEVGMGLVPPYPLGRQYRDLLGRVNARVAARADRAYLLVAGLALDLKRLSAG